jgi:KaiC/GvpD/RAD55 family RecA-like ATPase
MMRTGIEAWDRRHGGLLPGRHYLISGESGTGKTSMALHFIGAGLEAGETCAVLTQDDPADLVAHASYLGYDFRSAPAGALQLFRYRLDFQRSYARAAHPDEVFDELRALLAERMPDRLVIDTMLPFLQGGLAPEERVESLGRFLESLTCTTYVTVPGDLGESYYRRMYDRIVSQAAGLLHLELDAGVRRLGVRKLRQGSGGEESLAFTIRPGAGMVEELAHRPAEELPDSVRRRVVVLDAGAGVPSDWMDALENVFDVVVYDSVTRAFGELAAARYGALLVGTDPLNPDAAFSLTRELRAAGNGAPLLYVSTARGLRGSTRAQGLRAGGDDFLTDALPPEEWIARLESVRLRGHRRPSAGTLPAAPPLVHAPGPSGALLPLDPARFRAVLRDHVESSRYAFFGLVLLGGGALPPDAVWATLQRRLRLEDGDLVARLEGGRHVLYLHDIHRGQVRELLARLLESDPGLADADSTAVLCWPADRNAVSTWLRGGTAAAPAPAPAPRERQPA